MKLGRVVNHDPRSLAFPTRHANSPIIYGSHRRYGNVFDQGSVSSCTGNAGMGCLNTAPFYSGHLYNELDAVKVYSDATKGVYPPTDTGSSGLAVAKVLKSKGLIAGYEHAFSLNAALSAIGRTPVMIGVNWYDSMDKPSGTDALLTVTPHAVVRGGHELFLSAVYPKNKLVKGWNSWGRSWGNHGTFTMSFSTLERLLSEQGDCTVLVK